MAIAELDVESGGQGGESSSPSNTLNEVLDVVGNTRPFHRQVPLVPAAARQLTLA